MPYFRRFDCHGKTKTRLLLCVVNRKTQLPTKCGALWCPGFCRQPSRVKCSMVLLLAMLKNANSKNGWMKSKVRSLRICWLHNQCNKMTLTVTISPQTSEEHSLTAAVTCLALHYQHLVASVAPVGLVLPFCGPLNHSCYLALSGAVLWLGRAESLYDSRSFRDM